MTPTQQTLLDLAARVEGATGADRELDALIAAAARVGVEHHWAYEYPSWIGGKDGRVHLKKHGPSFEANPFTASLDDAMSLVPEGWVTTVAAWWTEEYDGRPAQFADCANLQEMKQGDEGSVQQAWAATKPLALTAAALRARAQ